MKLLLLTLLALTVKSSYSQDFPGTQKGRQTPYHSYYCDSGVDLPDFPGWFADWTSRERKGCKVESLATEKNQLDLNNLTPEGKNNYQSAVCSCLKQKTSLQRTLYAARAAKNRSWIEDMVWKRMGDHYRGRIYEQFNKMLQFDVLLQRGDVNENFMMYGHKCRANAIVEQIESMRGKNIDGHDCTDTSLFDKRLKLILKEKDPKKFLKNLQGDLGKIVKKKLSKEDIEGGSCITYQGLIAARMPSPIRFEILERLQKAKEIAGDSRFEYLAQVQLIINEYHGKYANSLGINGTNPLYNEDYVEYVQGEGVWKGSRKGIYNKSRVAREMQADPFLASLLRDQDFFKKVALTENPELAFHRRDNIKKVIMDQNQQCEKLRSPELLARMFCNPKLPPVDMNMIVKDISPELILNDDEGNFFKKKTNEYLAATLLCDSKKRRIPNGKKERWLPKEQDHQDNILEQVLKPRTRLVTDLEIIRTRNAGEPRYKDHETNVDTFNKYMCPNIREECRGTDMSGPNCNHLRHAIGYKPSRGLMRSHIEGITFKGQAIELTEEEIRDYMKRLLDVTNKYKEPFKVIGLNKALMEELLSIQADIYKKKFNHEIKPPYKPYNEDFLVALAPGQSRKSFIRDIRRKAQTLVQSHTYNHGREETLKARATIAFLEHHGDELREYFASLPEEQRITIQHDDQISLEMIDQFAESKNSSMREMVIDLRAKANDNSRLSRSLGGATNDTIVLTDTDTGETGTNFFTDYILSADDTAEISLDEFREGLGTNDESALTSLDWSRQIPTDGDGTQVPTSVDVGVPYTRNINSTDPTIDVLGTGDNNGQTLGDGRISGSIIPTNQALPQVLPKNPQVNSAPVIERDSLPQREETIFSRTNGLRNNPSPPITTQPAVTSKNSGDIQGLNSFTNEAPTRNDRTSQDSQTSNPSSEKVSNEDLLETLKDTRLKRDQLKVANQGLERAQYLAQRNQAAPTGQRTAANDANDYQSYEAPQRGSYMNPYTSNDGIDRFPASIENRLATGENKKQGNSPKESDQATGARGPASTEIAAAVSGEDGKSGAAPGAIATSQVPGFEGESISNCAIPTLIYTVQCYFPNKVFTTWSYLDEFSSEDEYTAAKENPFEFVSQLGLEGKAFIVVKEIPKRKEDKENTPAQVLVTTYDYFPDMLEDVEKMSDEKFRNKLISKILSERWNFLLMRDYAKKTKVLEQKVYDKNDFMKLAEERQLKPMISSVTEELYENVSKMNLRIQKENQTKIKALRSQIAAER